MQRIKELRKKHGMTQKQLALKLGVANSTLSTWEQGKFEPDRKSLVTIANIFDVSIDYLLDMESSPYKAHKFSVAAERSAYALILEDNPDIRRDGQVGEIVYKHNFQIFILNLLDLLMRNKETKDQWISLLSSITDKVTPLKISAKQMDALFMIMEYASLAMTTDNPDMREWAVNIFRDSLEKYGKRPPEADVGKEDKNEV